MRTRLAPSCSFFEVKYLTDDMLLMASLLPETGVILGTANNRRGIVTYIYIYTYIYIHIYIYIYIYDVYI